MAPSERPRTILMADDDADDCLLARDAVAQCGLPHRVETVPDGEALVDYLAGCGACRSTTPRPRPDLVLLDLNMPRADGREALRLLKQDGSWRRIPLVVLTTSIARGDVELAYRLGANSYVAKPIDFAGWVNLVRRLDEYWFGLVELPPWE